RLAFVYKAALNYFDGFSVNFWLKTGRGFEGNVDGFGNMLLYEPALILIGAFCLIWKRSKYGVLLVGWILIGPIATTFTKDIASTRLLHMVVPFILLEGVAIKFVWDSLTRIWPRILVYAVLVLAFVPILFVNVLYFDAYFRHLQAYAGKWWHKGYLEMVDLLNKYPDKQVYIRGRGNFTYIFVLFRDKYDPALFQKTAKWKTDPSTNITDVIEFGRYHFVDDIKKEDLCRDTNSIFVESKLIDKAPSFTPDGEIASLGAETILYNIPTPERCATK
ncbi:hypothetical protein HY024_02935, partial [Candidatus Curtissbacteria bacterium]|nr:hypothetical protein [Candidatus Curtissbacteria bacterium]